MHNARDISRQVWHSFLGGGRAGGWVFRLVWLGWNRREGGEFALQTPPTAVKTKAGYKGDFINVFQYLIVFFFTFIILPAAIIIRKKYKSCFNIIVLKQESPLAQKRAPDVNYR